MDTLQRYCRTEYITRSCFFLQSPHLPTLLEVHSHYYCPSGMNDEFDYFVNSFSSMTMFCCPLVIAGSPPTGSHLTGCLLKKGHGGTTRRKVSAVPPRPILSAKVISWRKKPTRKEMPYEAISWLAGDQVWGDKGSGWVDGYFLLRQWRGRPLLISRLASGPQSPVDNNWSMVLFARFNYGKRKRSQTIWPSTTSLTCSKSWSAIFD